MADRPLRPATRRRLGRPLPHQQADRPRAPPWPKNFPPAPMREQVMSGINPRFRRLSQSQGQVAHVLLTRSPLDLHQYCYRLDLVRLACVKHAASVRPEPESNSPLNDCYQPPRRPETRNPTMSSYIMAISVEPAPKNQPRRGFCTYIMHWLLARC